MTINDRDSNKTEVGLGIDAPWIEIEPHDDNDYDCDPACIVYTVGPETDDDTGSGKLMRGEDIK